MRQVHRAAHGGRARRHHRGDAAALAPDLGSRLHANVRLLEELGSEIVAHLDIGVRRIEAAGPADDAADEAPLDEAFLGRFAQQSDARIGRRMEVAIDVAALHFFNRSTGEVIAEQ